MYLKNLVKLRKAKKFSQKALAKKSGVSYNALIKIEQGSRIRPQIDTVIKLAKALEVSIDELVGQEKKKKKS